MGLVSKFNNQLFDFIEKARDLIPEGELLDTVDANNGIRGIPPMPSTMRVEVATWMPNGNRREYVLCAMPGGGYQLIFVNESIKL